MLRIDLLNFVHIITCHIIIGENNNALFPSPSCFLYNLSIPSQNILIRHPLKTRIHICKYVYDFVALNTTSVVQLC